MTMSVVWVHQGEAQLFHLSEERMSRDFSSHRIAGSANAMYGAIADLLGASRKILVVEAPDLVDEHFCEYLKSKHPALSRKVIGCEYSAASSEFEIATLATKYFLNPRS